MSEMETSSKVCERCGTATETLVSVDAGMRLGIKAAPGEELEAIPNVVCNNCYKDLSGRVSKGAKLRMEQKAREKNKQMLWKSRVNLIKTARVRMKDKAFTDAAVAYEKYLRVVEMAYDRPKGSLDPEVFGSTVRSKEITVIATVYWDLLRIYDSHPSYRQKMAESSQKLKQFLPFSKVYQDISSKAQVFAGKANNKDIMRDFIKGNKLAKPKCFIATAAFEAPMADEVVFLRNFRDTKLRKSYAGKAFVKLYYLISPLIAAVISRSETAKSITRHLLRLLIQRMSKNS